MFFSGSWVISTNCGRGRSQTCPCPYTLHSSKGGKTAQKITAISTYCPRIDLGDAAGEERYMELVTRCTTRSPGVVTNVQESEVETLIGLLRDGRPVHTGTAIYTPTIDLDGNFAVKVRVDKRVLRALNADGAFRGTLANAEHPGDPIEE